MLNLSVGMNQYASILVAVISLLIGIFQPLEQQVMIDSPKQGEAVQGQVIVTGTTQLENFQSYDVSFSYQHDSTNTWFPITESKEGVKAGNLASWDTTTITDGTYRLRIKVYLTDGRAVQTIVTGLRVRNYTPIETATPAPVILIGTGTPVPQEVVDYTAGGTTLTPIGENPVKINREELGGSLIRGGMIALLLFISLGFYLGLRALIRRG
jgi:hypothetical protein